MPGLMAFFGLDGSGFKNGLDEATRMAANSAAQMEGAFVSRIGGFLAVGAAVSAIKGAFNFGRELKDSALQIGITTTEVQQLTKAAGKVGLEFEDVARALIKVGSARREAAEGNEEMRAKFAGFGVDLRTLNDSAKSNLDIFRQVGEAISKINLTPRQRQELNDFFGRGGERMGAVMKGMANQGGVNIVSQDQVDRLDKADRLIGSIWGAIKKGITGTVADLLEPFNKSFWTTNPFAEGSPLNPFKPQGMGGTKRADLYGPGPDRPYEPLYTEKAKAEKVEKAKAESAEKTARATDRAANPSLNAYQTIGGYAGAANVPQQQLAVSNQHLESSRRLESYLNRLIQIHEKKFPNYHPKAQFWSEFQNSFK